MQKKFSRHFEESRPYLGLPRFNIGFPAIMVSQHTRTVSNSNYLKKKTSFKEFYNNKNEKNFFAVGALE